MLIGSFIRHFHGKLQKHHGEKTKQKSTTCHNARNRKIQMFAPSLLAFSLGLGRVPMQLTSTWIYREENLPTICEQKLQMDHINFPKWNTVSLSQRKSNLVDVFFKCSYRKETWNRTRESYTKLREIWQQIIIYITRVMIFTNFFPQKLIN